MTADIISHIEIGRLVELPYDAGTHSFSWARDFTLPVMMRLIITMNDRCSVGCMME